MLKRDFFNIVTTQITIADLKQPMQVHRRCRNTVRSF